MELIYQNFSYITASKKIMSVIYFENYEELQIQNMEIPNEFYNSIAYQEKFSDYLQISPRTPRFSRVK